MKLDGLTVQLVLAATLIASNCDAFIAKPVALWAPVRGNSPLTKDPITTTRLSQDSYDDRDVNINGDADIPLANGNTAVNGNNKMMNGANTTITTKKSITVVQQPPRQSPAIPITTSEWPSLDAEDRPAIEAGFRYSSDDWWRSFINVRKSYVLRRIKNHLGWTTLISAVVATLHHFFNVPTMPLLPSTLMGGFLSLLLVFRTNTAYARFWEARGHWSEAMKTCRGLAMSICAHIRPHSPRSAEKLLRLVALYPDALAYTCLAGTHPLAHNVKKVVYPRMNKAKVPPATVVSLMMQETIKEAEYESTTINQSHLEALHHAHLAHDANSLTRIFSACDKLVKTPVPWSYSRHTSRFLTMWTGTLPLAMVSTLGWLTVPVTAILCWALYGIEEIGQLLEQPFVGNQHSDDRQLKTKPYDIGVPVLVLANQIRYEVEQISCIPPPTMEHGH